MTYTSSRRDIHTPLTRDHTELMVDVALATTAAPTYLPAARLRNKRLVDGGLWANNPALIAVAEATSVLGVPLEQIRLLSMGATEEVPSLGRRLADGGLAQWRRPSVPLLLRAQAKGHFHAPNISWAGPVNVTRVDEVVPAGAFRLDKLNAARIRGLAESRAGHVCPAIKKFTAHRADTFQPSPLED